MSSRRKAKESSSFWTMSIGGTRSKGADDAVAPELFAPTLPGVNLLPTRVRESIEIRKSRTVLLALIAILAAASYGLWWMQSGTIERAQEQLAVAQKLNAELTDQVAALAPAKQFYAEVSALEALVSTTLADQPLSREVLSRLDAAVQETGGRPPISVLSAAVTYSGIPDPGAALSACPNPDPFNAEITIGCLTFSASADSRTQVSELLRILEADPLFVGPYVTTTTATGADEQGQGSVTFTGSAGISVEGLQTPLTDEQIEAIVNPPVDETAPGADDAEVGAADEEAAS